MDRCVWAVLGVLLSAIGLAGGCGWTPRDEFLRTRQTVFRAQPGNGSYVGTGWDAHEVSELGGGAATLASHPLED